VPYPLYHEKKNRKNKTFKVFIHETLSITDINFLLSEKTSILNMPFLYANPNSLIMLPKSTPHRLLFIDDDEDDFFILSEALKQIETGITVSYVQNCRQLSDFTESNFDIIFLDINMPVMNGIQCLKWLKDSVFRHIPVVMYSTTKNPVFIEEAYKSGANLFLRKPITFDALTSVLRSLLQLNWARPELITDQYSKAGAYRTFEAT
jgi:CheY-like chemotaxis protein